MIGLESTLDKDGWSAILNRCRVVPLGSLQMERKTRLALPTLVEKTLQYKARLAVTDSTLVAVSQRDSYVVAAQLQGTTASNLYFGDLSKPVGYLFLCGCAKDRTERD